MRDGTFDGMLVAARAGRNLKDDVWAEYVKRLKAGQAYQAFLEEQRERREILELERVASTVKTPLGMSKEAGSMRHAASIPSEAWEAHDALWPTMSVVERTNALKQWLPECFF